MYTLNQTLTLLIPITAIIWLGLSIYQLRTKKITTGIFAIYFIIGLVICIGAAFRDGYGFSESSLIPLSSTLSLVLSTLGLALFIITVLGIISKNQLLKSRLFVCMISIFVIKFVVVEMIALGQVL